MTYDRFKTRMQSLAANSPSGITVLVHRETPTLFIAEFSNGSVIIGQESENRLTYKPPLPRGNHHPQKKTSLDSLTYLEAYIYREVCKKGSSIESTAAALQISKGFVESILNRVQIVITRDNNMEKFIIKRPEKEVISLRISADLLKRVDLKANQHSVSRNELLNQMIAYALSNMEESNNDRQ